MPDESNDHNESTHQIAFGLGKDVQDHLGKELRGLYKVVADQPAYLGDPTLPRELEDKLARLDTRIAAGEQGIEAVENALFATEQPDSRTRCEQKDRDES